MTAVVTQNAITFNFTAWDNESADLWHSRVNAMDDNDDHDDAVSQGFSQHAVVHFESSMLFQELCVSKEAKGLEEDMEFMMSSSIMTDLTDALDDMLSMDDDDNQSDLEVEPLPLQCEPPLLVFENEIRHHFVDMGSTPASSCSPSMHPNSVER